MKVVLLHYLLDFTSAELISADWVMELIFGLSLSMMITPHGIENLNMITQP